MSSSEPSAAPRQFSNSKDEPIRVPIQAHGVVDEESVLHNSFASTALAEKALAGDLLAEHALMARAGTGDIEAQRIFLGALLSTPLTHPRGRQEILAMCELVARLIAARGDQSDVLTLASILVLRAGAARTAGDEAAAVAYEARCLTIFERIADCGNEAAAEALNALAAECAPAAVRLAAASQRELQNG